MKEEKDLTQLWITIISSLIMEENRVTIASLNLCLGLANKKLEVENLINNNHLDVLCLHETEIPKSMDPKILAVKDFVLELENNSVKARTGIYLSNCINYKRKSELEGIDSNLLIVDIYTKKGPKRLINIYRSFNPQNNV